MSTSDRGEGKTSGTDDSGKLTTEQLAAIGAAATGLIGGIGALTLTGALGRVQRNNGPWLALAIGLVVIGVAVFVGAGMIPDSAGKFRVKVQLRSAGRVQRILGILLALALIVLGAAGLIGLANAIRRAQPSLIAVVVILTGAIGLIAGIAFTRSILRVELNQRDLRRWHNVSIGIRELVKAVGTLLVSLGLIVGFVVAITSAGESEQPSVTLALAGDGSSLTASANVGDLGSADRLSVKIDGLVNPSDNQSQTQTPVRSQVNCPADAAPCYIVRAQLYKGYVGPNSDGHATTSVTVPVPPDEFDAVAISAYTSRNPAGCGQYPTGASNQKEGTGCAVVQLPVRRDAPQLSASWDGNTAIQVSLRSDIARLSTGVPVLLRITGLRKTHTTLVYSGIMHTSTSIISRNIRVALPPGFRLVCLDAQTIPPYDPPPPLKTPCPLQGAKQRPLSEQAAIELDPPTSTTPTKPPNHRKTWPHPPFRG